MNKEKIERLLLAYSRNQLNIFSVQDVQNYYRTNKINLSEEEITKLIDENQYCIPLKNSYYITRAGIFTGKPFSIKPTQFEITNGILIIGHRFMPFVDPTELPHDIKINFFGSQLEFTSIEIPVYNLIPYYQLFGEEYFSQILSFDPANDDYDVILSDKSLNTIVNVTVVDCKNLYSFFNFKYGDRLHAVVSDWDTLNFEIVPNIKENDNPFKETSVERKRKKWFKNAENALIEVFNNYGACKSIDMQLCLMYMENLQKLCIPESGSIEELLEKSTKIGIGVYGVESRLWFKGEDIPAMSAYSDISFVNEDSKEKNPVKFLNDMAIPDFIVDSFIMDSLFRKEKDINLLAERIFLENLPIKNEDKKIILLHLQKKRDILVKEYNWFADYDIGFYRQRALNLYLKLMELGNELDYYGQFLNELPQQPLAIFAQMVEYISHLIATLATLNLDYAEELDTVSATLDGMEFSFEEISEILYAEIKNHQKDLFSVIKREDKNGI